MIDMGDDGDVSNPVLPDVVLCHKLLFLLMIYSALVPTKQDLNTCLNAGAPILETGSALNYRASPRLGRLRAVTFLGISERRRVGVR
jgi:hypothetical protein